MSTVSVKRQYYLSTGTLQVLVVVRDRFLLVVVVRSCPLPVLSLIPVVPGTTLAATKILLGVRTKQNKTLLIASHKHANCRLIVIACATKFLDFEIFKTLIPQ
jgi:hypothetical protein